MRTLGSAILFTSLVYAAAYGETTAGASCGIACGDRIEVINSQNVDGDRLLVRTEPCADTVIGPCGALCCDTICGRVWNGAQGRVVGGPLETANGYRWWDIQWDAGWPEQTGPATCTSRIGYSAEGEADGSECWLTTVTPGCCVDADCDDGAPCTSSTCSGSPNYTCQTIDICAERYTLTVHANPSNGGDVLRDPEPDPDGKYADGTQVKLTAWPNTTYTLLSWSGDASGSSYTTTVTMNDNRTVTANFGDARDGILKVFPSAGFLASGPTVDEFEPQSQNYTLTNIGGQPLGWQVSRAGGGNLPTWLAVSPESGTLQPGAQTSVTVELVHGALPATLCRYKDRIVFQNTSNGDGTTQRDIVVLLHDVCSPGAGLNQCPYVPGIPGSISKITVNIGGLKRWNGVTFQTYSGLVPIDLNSPTFILVHGWEGDTTIWHAPEGETAERLSERYPGGVNILAYDWSGINGADPNGLPDTNSWNILLAAIETAQLMPWRAVSGWSDAYVANINAGTRGTLLAEELFKYPALGTELHFIGKSLGGGLSAMTTQILSRRGRTVNSLTMVDAPNVYPVNAMQYLDAQAADRTLVFYYNDVGRCGFGKPGAYPAIHLKMRPGNNDGGFCVHQTITEPGAWFPEMIRNGLVLGNRHYIYPNEIAEMDRSTWWIEMSAARSFQPLGACCSYGTFWTQECAHRIPADCPDRSTGWPPFQAYMGDHSLCASGVCPGGTVAGEALEVADDAPGSGNQLDDPHYGMVTLLTFPLDAAAEWQGDKVVVATGLDPDDPDNSVVFLQEDGDAAFYRDLLFPPHSVVLAFDYMFREPRGDENLTVYLDDDIVYYDHAGTTLATDGLMPGSSIYIAGVAGTTARLAFVLRTDGVPGGGVLIDNVRILGFAPTDVTGDRRVDLRDFALLQRCFGTDPPELDCTLADVDRNAHVSAADFRKMHQCLTGPDVPADPVCSAPPICGNGILEPGEECDPPNGRTCDATCRRVTPEPDGQIVGWGWQVVGVDLSEGFMVRPPGDPRPTIAAGGRHSLGLKADGSIEAWGSNFSGESMVPEPNSGFVAVAAGVAHSLGLKDDGSIVTWGLDQVYETDVPSPNADFIGIAAGDYHSLGLKAGGSITAWGCDESSSGFDFGQCDVPESNADFIAIAAGWGHSLGLKADGSVVAWGCGESSFDMDFGQCDVPEPNIDFIGIAAGTFQSLGLRADGSIVAWGCGDWTDSGQCDVPAPDGDFIAIAAGAAHSLGLKADGSIVAWGCGGGHDYGQCNLPAPNSDFVAIAAGSFHSLGLKADGSIVSWGDEFSSGQTNVPAPNSGFEDVAAGVWHNLGLKADGSIVAWGCGGGTDYGQCNVPPNADFIAIAAGANHSLGLKADGSIVAWGCGDGTDFGQCDVPVPNADFIAIAAGANHSLGLKANGTIVAWGCGDWTDSGQCNLSEPNANFDFIAIAAGANHSLGLKADGSIVAWGANWFGQTDVPEPNTDFITIAAGWGHSLGLKADGSIVGWGAGECGASDMHDVGQSCIPVKNSDFVGIAAGWYHSLALKADGSIEAWGHHPVGQTSVPGPNTDYVAIAAGWYHSLALRADGSIVAWGANWFQADVPSPNADYIAIAAGWGHSLGLKADGAIVAWGCDASFGFDFGQCDVPDPNADFIAIAAGDYHSLGLKADGTIVAWGCGDWFDYGQCNAPAPNADFIAIAAGTAHSVGLKGDGSIVPWGDNIFGQLDVPAPNANFISIAVARHHSLGLRADGSIVGWGANWDGQLDVSAPNADFIAIATGWSHSLGLRVDGSIVPWGAGACGQSGSQHFGQSCVPEPNSGFVAIAAGGSNSLAIRGNP